MGGLIVVVGLFLVGRIATEMTRPPSERMTLPERLAEAERSAALSREMEEAHLELMHEWNTRAPEDLEPGPGARPEGFEVGQLLVTRADSEEHHPYRIARVRSLWQGGCTLQLSESSWEDEPELSPEHEPLIWLSETLQGLDPAGALAVRQRSIVRIGSVD